MNILGVATKEENDLAFNVELALNELKPFSRIILPTLHLQARNGKMQSNTTNTTKPTELDLEPHILTIYKVLNVSAAHQLNLPYESKCNNLHGHNWKVEVWITGTLNETGMVLDYNHIKREIMKLDHQNINEFVTPPTAEMLSIYWAKELSKINPGNLYSIRIKVWETPTSFAEFTLELM